MSLINEVFREINKDGEKTLGSGSGGTGTQISAPSYNPSDVLQSHSSGRQQQPPLRPNDNESKTGRIGSVEMVHPSLDLSRNEVEKIKEQFMWVYNNSKEVEKKYENNLDSVLNDPKLMMNVIEQFQKYLDASSEEESHIENTGGGGGRGGGNGSPKEEEGEENGGDKEDFNNKSSPWLLLLNEIKYPIVMGVVYYLLNSKSCQNYITNTLPVLNEYYNFKLILLSLAFVIMSILVKKLLEWVSD